MVTEAAVTGVVTEAEVTEAAVTGVVAMATGEVTAEVLAAAARAVAPTVEAEMV